MSLHYHQARRAEARAPEALPVIAEDAYDQLLEHVQRCARCFESRNELWRVARLCRSGQILSEAYAALAVVASRRSA